MSMQGELKPNIHMDIPPGELHLLFDAASNSPLMQNSHYHSLRNVKVFFLLARSPKGASFSFEKNAAVFSILSHDSI